MASMYAKHRVAADERAEQLQWLGSNATTPYGQLMLWSACYILAFDEDDNAVATFVTVVYAYMYQQ